MKSKRWRHLSQDLLPFLAPCYRNSPGHCTLDRCTQEDGGPPFLSSQCGVTGPPQRGSCFGLLPLSQRLYALFQAVEAERCEALSLHPSLTASGEGLLQWGRSRMLPALTQNYGVLNKGQPQSDLHCGKNFLARMNEDRLKAERALRSVSTVFSR